MHFRIYKPHPSVSHVVDYYWHTYADLKESIVQEVPTPLLQGMTINLSGRKEQMQFPNRNQNQQMGSPIYIFGQALSPRLSISNEEGIDVLGVKFTALGFHLLSGMKVQHLTDEIVDAEDVWGKEVAYLGEALYEVNDVVRSVQLLDGYFYRKLSSSRNTYIHPCVAEALQLINNAQGNIRIKELQKDIHTSPSTLERAFLNQLGMTPKMYSRILRYNKVKALIDQGKADWQHICFNFGYFDQSHFIKEFKRYSGLTPEAYLLKNSKLENVF